MEPRRCHMGTKPNMELVVHRTKNGDKACTGTLDVDGVQDAFTLEDVIRDLGPDGKGKIYGDSGIPEGRYKIGWYFWPRFGRNYLHVEGVPFFTGILIHAGEKHEDTLGCLLVGTVHLGDDLIRGGMSYLGGLNARVKAAMDEGREVWITYKNEFPEPLK
jgi:hypothetical protein